MNNRALMIFLFLALANGVGYSQLTIGKEIVDVWVIRGKVVPWVFLGTGVNYSLGIEYGFKEIHSIAIDFEFNAYSFPNDRTDSITKAEIAGPRLYTVVRGLLFTYKRYLEYTEWKDYRFRPYVAGFVRAGNSDEHPESGYVTSVVKHDERNISAGVLVGAITPFKIRGFNFDLSMGPFYKQKQVDEFYYDYFKKVAERKTTQTNFGWRVGFTLAYILPRSHSQI